VTVVVIIGGMEASKDELAGCLRSWRERLQPVDAGLPSGGRRRVNGLRREEVAQLAGLSVDYLARLEQSRAHSPSPSVVNALARALRLSREERAHLLRLSGHAEPRPGSIDRHLTPSVRRLLDRWTDLPVMVVDAANGVIEATPLATALVGDLSGLPRRERNLTWRHFTGAPSPLRRTPEEWEDAEESMVAELHDAIGRFPADEPLRSLVEDLQAVSPRFAALWEGHCVARSPAKRKTFHHPQVGLLTLDCDALTVDGSDVRLVVYTAAPGSPDADALALLAAVGLQDFAAR
jgi:hypothetical protein